RQRVCFCTLLLDDTCEAQIRSVLWTSTDARKKRRMLQSDILEVVNYSKIGARGSLGNQGGWLCLALAYAQSTKPGVMRRHRRYGRRNIGAQPVEDAPEL